jgi:NADPH:quinone reductase-like Zn-dependent oxidoreductase
VAETFELGDQRIEEIPLPTPAAGQVLVKVAATSVNPNDWECLRGSPFYDRPRRGQCCGRT